MTRSVPTPEEVTFAAFPNRDYEIKSALRVLEIFELFQTSQRPLSAAEMALALGYPYSSIAALVKFLTKEGYLRTVGPNRRLLPTLRVAVLGNRANQTSGRGGKLLTKMEELRKKTGLSVGVQVRSGIYSQMVQFLPEVAQRDWQQVRLGMVRLLTKSSSGRLIMSSLEDGEILRIVRRCNVEGQFDDEEPVNSRDVMDEVTAIRANGFIYLENTVVEGGAYVGVPLVAADADAAMALGIGSTVDNVRPVKDSLVEMLLEAAKELNAAPDECG